MKKIQFLITVFFVLSCSSTRISESWKNPEYVDYQPSKVLIMGVTPNLTARTLYEEKLKTVLNNKGILAEESFKVFNSEFTSLKQTEEDIQNQLENLADKGFDAILISAVKGYDERISYTGELIRTDQDLRRFGTYYYLNQDVYFDESSYNEYKVYHIEISLYNLKSNSEKSLVWVASYDIIDPKKINATIKDCVNAIVATLEDEEIIPIEQKQLEFSYS